MRICWRPDVSAIFVAFVVFAAVSIAPAQSVPEAYPEVKIAATDGATADEYGYSVAVSGDWAAVGVPYADAVAADAGAVYMYYRHQGGTDNWGLVKKITAPDGAAGDLFGWSVSLSGEMLIVGAPAATDSNAGAVYAFGQNTDGTNNWGWWYSTRLMAPTPEADAQFGYSVSTTGSRLAIGCPYADAPDTNSGFVTIYHNYYGWPYDRTITAIDAAKNANFGKAVALAGDNLVAGAPGVNQTYIHDYAQGGSNNWGYQAMLVPDPVDGATDFGSSVAISGSYVVVGAPTADGAAAGSGVAYVYYENEPTSNTWGRVGRLMADGGTENDFFASAVSVSGKYVLVGAPAFEGSGVDAGAAYLFYRGATGTGAWDQIAQLTSSDIAASDNFGASVGISGMNLIVAATGESGKGAAYALGLGTAVSGSITTQTWTENGSPYRVTGAVSVPTGNTLTIQEGVIVLFDSDVPFDIQGSLMTAGTEADPVVFEIGSASEWGGIRISGGDSSAIVHTVIKDGDADGTLPLSYGGGLYASGSGTRVLVQNSTITNNDASLSGAGIAVRESATLYVEASEVTWNTAVYHGGGILVDAESEAYIDNSLIKSNIANTYTESKGAGITVFDTSYVRITNSTLTANASTSLGGGLYVSGSEVDIENSAFTYCSAELSGGGMFLADGAVVNVYDSDVSNCRNSDTNGLNGAGIHASGVLTLNMYGCTISGNWTDDDGGGIGITGGASVTLEGCTVASNVAMIDGGGIWVSGGSLVMRECDVIDNRPEYNGAGIWIGGGSSALIEDSNFDGNICDPSGTYGTGGAIFIINATDVTVRGTRLANNIVHDNGGALCMRENTAALFEDCRFVDNMTDDNGGAVYLYTTTTNTISVVFNDCEFLGNRTGTGNGGAIHAEYASIEANDCDFIGNFADYKGGALSLAYATVFAGDHCVLRGNSALSEGGATTMYSNASMTLTNCTVTGNTAESVFVMEQYHNTASITLRNTIVWGNQPADIENYGNFSVNYSITEPKWSGTGNSSANPMFVNSVFGDLRLRPGSPAIDAGDPASPKDPDSSRADIGAQQFQGSLEFGSALAEPGSTIVVPLRATFQNIYSAELAVVIDPAVLAAAADPIFETAFDTIGTALRDWNVVGDTLFASVASETPISLDDRVLMRLAFVAREDAPLESTSPLMLVPELSAINEGAPMLRDGLVRVSSAKMGDVTGDGSIASLDASLVLQHMVHKIAPDSIKLDVADVSGNGEIASLDAALILAKVSDPSYVFPVHGGGLPKAAAAREASLVWSRAESGWALDCVGAEGLMSGTVAIELASTMGVSVVADRFASWSSDAGVLTVAFASPVGSQEAITRLFTVEGVTENDAAPAVLSSELNEGAIEVTEVIGPTSFRLAQNIPNPFNPSTTIEFSVPSAGFVELAIFNVSGQLINRIVGGELQAGDYHATWNGTDAAGRSVASGVYVYRLHTKHGTLVRRMVMVR